MEAASVRVTSVNAMPVKTLRLKALSGVPLTDRVLSVMGKRVAYHQSLDLFVPSLDIKLDFFPRILEK